MIIVYIYCLINMPYSIWQMINVIKQIKREIEKYNAVNDNRLYDWSKEK